MAYTKKVNAKKKGKAKQPYSIDELENMDSKTQNMVFSLLSKYKGILIPILLFILLNIISIVLTFLMAFGLL